MQHHTKLNLIVGVYKLTQLTIVTAMFVSIWVVFEVFLFEGVLSGETLTSITFGQRLQIAIVLFGYVQVGQKLLQFLWWNYYQTEKKMHFENLN